MRHQKNQLLAGTSPTKTARFRLASLLAAVSVASAGMTLLIPSGPAGAADGIAVSGGSPQTAMVNKSFSTALSVLVTQLGAPAQNLSVTFSTPTTGASGIFSTSNSTSVTVGTNSSGIATAPTFTANGTAGTYSVTASGTVDGLTASATITLTNTVTGVASGMVIYGGNNQSASEGAQFPSALQLELFDANGIAVPNTNVTFAVQAGSSGASATYVTGGNSITELTNSSGIATTPLLTANNSAGNFTIVATTPGLNNTTNFIMTVAQGSATYLVPGSGSPQSTAVGQAFSIPLAVTVTDANNNPVVGIGITFTAPGSGPGGTFAGSGTSTVSYTDYKGIAVAPTFIANAIPGGYVVTAGVPGLSATAAFSLVNQAPSAATVGYWLASSTGNVFDYGSAANYGSAGNIHLSAPVVGIAATPDGKGYWLVAADGGVFTYGDAGFYGSAGNIHLSAPVVGIAATPDGKGYWLVAADGGVFTYGDAGFYGSAEPVGDQTIRTVVAGPGGTGYYLSDSVGIVYGYGSASAGSTLSGAQSSSVSSVVGIARP